VDVRELRAFAAADSATARLGLRHDVDDRIDSALVFARTEHDLGLRATYFVLHTASYYAEIRAGRVERNPSVLEFLLEIQALGHEIGWHNDLVTLECVYGIDAGGYLREELAWLRDNGIAVVGTAPHGSYWCHVLGYTNSYFFRETLQLDPDFPNREAVAVDGERRRIPHASLADFGLAYDAEQYDIDLYRSDAFYDPSGRRWHPESLDVSVLRPGVRVIVSTHPCLWDRSAAGKALRAALRAAPMRRRVT
jgi:hypothetical protein